MKSAKRLVAMVLVLLVTLLITACGTESDIHKEIEKELGDIYKLSVDIDEAIAQTGREPVRYQSNITEGNKAELAVFENTVLYSTTRLENESTEDGTPYTYTLTVLHVGKYSSGDENVLTIQFTGAHITMSIASENVDLAKTNMKSKLDNAPVGRDVISLYNNLVDGEQIYVTTDSILWDELVDIKTELKVSYNADDGSFVVKFDGEVGVLYHDETRDENDRVTKKISYYYDETGAKWIESTEESTYLDTGGTLLKITYYYPNSDQISEVKEMLSDTEITNAAIHINTKILMEQEFYEDGTLKLDYHDYSESEGEEHFKRVYYYANGQVLHEEYIDENGVHLTAEYNEDGSVRIYEKFLNEQILEVVNEDGTKNTWEYYDDMNLHFERWYNSEGILYREREFQLDGTYKDYFYDRDGNIITD